MSLPIRLSPLRVLVAFGGVLIAMLGAAVPASAQLKATLVASGFNAPLGFVQDPSDPTVQVVLEQAGHVRVLKNGVTQSADFLDVSALLPPSPLGERGLLGLAFAPDYAASGRVYISFTNASGHSVISRYRRSPGNPLQADPTTRFDLVWPGGLAYVLQPFTNHNGGNIAFGTDGYLYFGLGDGGSGNDPQFNGQKPTTLLGKMLRLDVSVADSDPKGYAIPPSNPFAGRGDILNEIWAFGLRNPWRWSFDARRAGSTGALIIGDVGQDAWEEVDYVPRSVAGRNFGWGNREGAHTNGSYAGGAPPAAAPAPLRDPTWEYSHSVGRSITGGAVYRGRGLGPTYIGRYFVADYAMSKVWSLSLTLDGVTREATVSSAAEHTSELGNAATSVSSFGVDAAGEIYIVNYGGTIYRIDSALGAPADGCSVADPYLAAGGGRCVNGMWHSPVSGADFNNDSAPDIVFQNTSNQIYAWFMAGHTLAVGAAPSPNQLPADTLVVGTADLSGDERPDLLLQNQQTGAVTLWIMNGVTRTATQAIPIANNTPWRIMATADLDGDGHADIIWQNFATGQVYVWFMTSSGGVANHPVDTAYVQDGAATIVTVGSTVRIVGAADLNGDGKADLIFQDSGGNLAAWYMDGRTVTAGLSLTPARVAGNWRIKAVTDLNADQHPDLLWQNTSTGDLYVWYLIGTDMVRAAYVAPSRINTTWTIVGPK
ncbi:MAG: PQQ-dependent sugar dehydrogenase [Acidobacteriota bacterium]